MNEKLPSLRRKLRILPREELNALVIKAQKGCLISRNTIVEHNLGLVPKECVSAVYYNHPTITFDDLYQQGVLGLIEATKGFDPSKGFAFSTYSKFWIKQRISRYIKDHKSVIRVPVYALEIKSKYETIKKQRNDKDEEFWLRLVSKEKGVSYENVKFIIEHNPSICSLDKENEEGDSLLDISYDLFNDEYHQGLDYSHMLRIMRFLPTRDRKILIRRYEGNTYGEVAEEFSLSREAVRQICNNSLRKLRALVNLKTRNILEEE